MLEQAVTNRIPFKYVLNDVWFASAENVSYVKHDLKKEFVMPLKTNCVHIYMCDICASRSGGF